MKKLSQKDFKRFDMAKKPQRQHLRWLIALLSIPDANKHKCVITKINMEGVKPPYLLLVNHNAFLDFKVVEKAVLPARTNSVVAIDGYIKREWLLRAVGCICKRKFTRELTMVRHLHTVVDNGDIVVLYPEARYSLCGTDSLLPDSLGKLAKYLKVPLVTFITHGHHVNSPFWNLAQRGNRVESTMKQLFTAEEMENLSVEDINEAIQSEFDYDDFKWQKDNKISIKFPRRAEGLHKVLYQCPHCNAEYHMDSKGEKIFCKSCGKSWSMTEYGELEGNDGVTEFSHIPDWYEWERDNVAKEVADGAYSFSCEAIVKSLPNSRGYINLGKATLTHNMDGFTVSGEYNGEKYEMVKPVKSLYSTHIEYNYLGKYGDCVDLNTMDDTYYVYPQNCLFSVTKMALATEELYKHECGYKGIIEKKK